MRSAFASKYLTVALSLAGISIPTAITGQSCVSPCVGPAQGAIVAAGGGALDLTIYERFVELSGGRDARVVLIPTAGTEFGGQDGWTAIEKLRDAGLQHLEVLHTRSRSVADLDAFSSPLDQATGVWFSGGHQWRLVDVYLGTRTHARLDSLLARGGVIGGNSAGASALASFLLRGGEFNGEIVATERATGFGFLTGVAIDQHLAARGREHEMFEVLAREPMILGIGLNEGSAIVVSGDTAHVFGGAVAIYDNTDPSRIIPMRWLESGEAYDLGRRRLISDPAPKRR